MKSDGVYSLGDELVERFQTRNPFEIADMLGIHVLFCAEFGPLKGMYRVLKRNRFIFINRDLYEPMQMLVCAHEVAHDQQHRWLGAVDDLKEFTFYDMTSQPEYEANIVAADILLDSDEVLDYIYEYRYSIEQIARAMYTDPNLVALKIKSLNHKGHSIPEQFYRSDFLK